MIETDTELEDRIYNLTLKSEYGKYTLTGDLTVNELYRYLCNGTAPDTYKKALEIIKAYKYSSTRKFNSQIKPQSAEYALRNQKLSLTDQTIVNTLTDYLLGEDWYIVDPICTAQANVTIVETIEKMYRKSLVRRICRKRGNKHEEKR